jgi:hypothetical protein
LFHLKSLDEELQRRRYAGHINNCVAKFHKIASASKFIRNSSVLKANYKWLKLMYNGRNRRLASHCYRTTNMHNLLRMFEVMCEPSSQSFSFTSYVATN